MYYYASCQIDLKMRLVMCLCYTEFLRDFPLLVVSSFCPPCIYCVCSSRSSSGRCSDVGQGKRNAHASWKRSLREKTWHKSFRHHLSSPGGGVLWLWFFFLLLLLALYVCTLCVVKKIGIERKRERSIVCFFLRRTLCVVCSAYWEYIDAIDIGCWWPLINR
jgi:hypothetical protein